MEIIEKYFKNKNTAKAILKGNFFIEEISTSKGNLLFVDYTKKFFSRLNEKYCCESASELYNSKCLDNRLN